MTTEKQMVPDTHFEHPDPTPIARPMRFNRAPSTLDDLRRMMGILSREAAEQGHETFEEADDFEVGDDYDPKSRFELDPGQETFVPPPPPPPVVAGASGAPSPQPPSGAHVPPAPVPPAAPSPSP